MGGKLYLRSLGGWPWSPFQLGIREGNTHSSHCQLFGLQIKNKQTENRRQTHSSGPRSPTVMVGETKTTSSKQTPGNYRGPKWNNFWQKKIHRTKLGHTTSPQATTGILILHSGKILNN
jgi:hypothetical protein